MARSTPDSHAPQQNHLLDALPAAERQQIYPHLQLVEMPLGKVVHEPGTVHRYAYFPTDCPGGRSVRNSTVARRFGFCGCAARQP
jgi:hypothetical protein